MEFNWDYGVMENSITDLEGNRKTIADFADNLKDTLKNELLAAGMTGPVAEALSETSITEVDNAVETFLSNFDSFTKVCRDANTRMEELEKANITTAGM